MLLAGADEEAKGEVVGAESGEADDVRGEHPSYDGSVILQSRPA